MLAWLLLRSGLPRHGNLAGRLGAAGVFVLAAMELGLLFLVFVLAAWQWRQSGRGRVRLLVAIYLSLLPCFCGLAWHEVCLAQAKLPAGLAAPSAMQQVAEQSAAVGVSMVSLLAGLVAVIVILRLERRGLNRGE